MLHLIPAPLHRRLLDLAHRVRVVWWRLAKPNLVNCRVIAIDSRGRVLLVRHSYGSGVWMLPGGAPRRGEDALSAASRELREEVGCAITDAVVLASPPPDATRRTFVVAGRTSSEPVADRREIVDARFFKPGALPDGVSPLLARRLQKWLAAYRAAD